MLKYNAKSWMIVAAVCIGVTILIFLSILPSVSFGSEILKSNLCVNDISIKKAAELTGYTGCMDSAYQISHIVCIVDGDTTRCVSIGKRGKGLVENIETETEYAPAETMDKLTDAAKAVEMWPSGEVFSQCASGCPKLSGGKYGKYKYYSCVAKNLYDFGYYGLAITYLHGNYTVTEDDLAYADNSLAAILILYRPREDHHYRIRESKKMVKQIHEQFESQGAK